MPLTLVTPPAAEPVSLTTAKAHLRVDTTADDALITALITAARQRFDGADGVLGRALITQTWDLWLDAFPTEWGEDKPIELLSPVQSISYVKYLDSASVLQTLVSGTDYLPDIYSAPARILAGASGWASPGEVPNAVNVRFVAGYGLTGANVPGPIIQAILLTIGHWYENRGVAGAELPFAIDRMVMNYRASWAV